MLDFFGSNICHCKLFTNEKDHKEAKHGNDYCPCHSKASKCSMTVNVFLCCLIMSVIANCKVEVLEGGVILSVILQRE